MASSLEHLQSHSMDAVGGFRETPIDRFAQATKAVSDLLRSRLGTPSLAALGLFGALAQSGCLQKVNADPSPLASTLPATSTATDSTFTVQTGQTTVPADLPTLTLHTFDSIDGLSTSQDAGELTEIVMEGDNAARFCLHPEASVSDYGQISITLSPALDIQDYMGPGTFTLAFYVPADSAVSHLTAVEFQWGTSLESVDVGYGEGPFDTGWQDLEFDTDSDSQGRTIDTVVVAVHYDDILTVQGLALGNLKLSVD